MPMKDSSTDSGRITIATSAERACIRNTKQIAATMMPSSISVRRSVPIEPRISSERS